MFRQKLKGRVSAAALVAALLALALSGAVTGLVLHPIVMDGSLVDWGDVLTDPENGVADSAADADPADPDLPGTADRDLRGVAFTWDATNLYFWFRRNLQGNSSFDFLLYLDLDEDRLLDSTDVVLQYSYNGSNLQFGRLHSYVPADPAGDPITGDGATEPGSLGTLLSSAPFGVNSSSGIEFEVGVPWSALGIAAGSCLWVHPSISRGSNLPDQVEDNTAPLHTRGQGVRLEADRRAGASSPGVATHAHQACNGSNCGDTLELTAASAEGWTLELWTDPNGDGDPADGQLMAVDVAGDGDYHDAGDFVDAAFDSSGNGQPDTGSLAGGACFDFVLRVLVPAGVPGGTTDVERVGVRAGASARGQAEVRDETRVGPVVVFGNESRSGVADGDVWLPHVACNEQAFSDTLDLAAVSTLGFAWETWSDPDGDGDPADGMPVLDAGLLAPGECFTFLLRVTIPPGTPAGTLDELVVSATSRADILIRDEALDRVEVFAAAFTLTPDHDRLAGPGNALFLPHVITVHAAQADSFVLSTVASLPGWTFTFLTDPDGDGEPAGSSIIVPGMPLGPVAGNGGTIHFILRIDVPLGAALGAVNTITVNCASEGSPGEVATATDIVRIRRVLTYSDPLFARPAQSNFLPCNIVYVQAHGLQSNRIYRFRWYDTVGMLQRTSPEGGPDDLGRSDDSLGVACGALPGDWTVQLEVKSGNQWLLVADGSATFTILDGGAAGTGEITDLRTDQAVYEFMGETISAWSELLNDSVGDLLGTIADYVLFQDANADGVPSAGEDWIQSDGTAATWSPGDITWSTTDIDLLSGQNFQDAWEVGPVTFPALGEWCLRLEWWLPCVNGPCSRQVIDTELTCFLVTCTVPPDVQAGPDLLACLGAAFALDGAVSDAPSLLWDDGGAGGVFAPTATELHPTWTAPAPGTYVLTLTGSVSGECPAVDQVTVEVVPPPVAEAGPDAVLTCDDPEAVLQGAASGGDGSAGYAYAWEPAADVSDPAVPMPTVVTAGSYTLTVTDIATGCTATDTVAVTGDANAPVAFAGPDQFVGCTGAAVTLLGGASGGNGSAGYSYAWTPPLGLSDPALAQPTTIVPGTYTLTVTDIATGCTAADMVVVALDANQPTADAGPDQVLTCGAPSATLVGSASGGNGSAGWSYAWTPAGDVSDPAAAVTTTSLSGTYVLTVTDLANGCTHSDAVVVSEDSLAPVADAGPDLFLTCTLSQVELMGSASGGNGTAGYAFAWEPAGNLSDPTAASPTTGTPGTYTLTVTDLANGCTATDEVVVAADASAPVANAGPDVALTCAAPQVVLSGSAAGGNGSAGYAYLWAPAGSVSNPTAAMPTTLLAGIYTLTVTDVATGCSSTDTVVVAADNAAPLADAGPDRTLTCAATGAVLLGSASGGNGSGGYAYSWSPTVGLSDPASATPTASAPGLYTLTVTALASGCTDADSVVVTNDTAAPLASAGSDLSITCTSPTVTLAGSASGGNGTAGYAFAWAPAAGVSDPALPMPTTALPGTYVLTVTGLANGCTDTDEVLVTDDRLAPVASAGPDRVITCALPVVTLSGAAMGGNGGLGYAFAWSPAADVSDPALPNPTTAIAGTYTLTVTDLANGCSAQDSVLVVADVDAPVASAGPDRVLTCASPTVVLMGSASGGNGTLGWSYAWSPANALSDPSVAMPTASAPGFYTLLVTDLANGCTHEDTVVVTQDVVAPVASAGADTAVSCGSPVATLSGSASGGNGTAGYTYAWSPAANVASPSTALTTTAVAGTYALTVTSVANGCSATDQVVVVNDAVPPTANAGPDRTLTCALTQVTLSGSASGGNGSAGYAFSWSPAGDVSDSAAAQPTTITPGLYTLTVTALASGCTSQDVVQVFSSMAAPTAGAGPDRSVTCAEPVATLSGSASGGDGSAGYSFAWSPPADVSSPSAQFPTTSTPGTYVLTVTALATGCTALDSVVVTGDAETPLASAGPDRAITCTTAMVTLSGSASGGNASMGYAYSWSPPLLVSDPAAASPTTTTPGAYVLTVTALATGCTATDSVVVADATAAPVAEAGPNMSLTCTEQQLVLAGSASGGAGQLGHSFAWTPLAGLTDAETATPTATLAGTYTLTVTDIETGCTHADSVVVSDDTAAPTAFAGPDRIISCEAPLATLTGSAAGGNGSLGYAYAWEPALDLTGADTATPTTLLAGTYTLTVTALATGCTATDMVTVTDNAVDPTADAGPDQVTTCDASVVMLAGAASGGNGSLGYAYSWSPAGPLVGPNTAAPTTTTPGTYTLTVTALASGCTATDEVLVVGDAVVPMTEAGPAQTITCATPQVTLMGSASGGNGTGGYAFSWQPAMDLTGPTTALPTTTIPGTYTLTVTALATGCTATDTVVVLDDTAPPVPSAGPDRSLTCAATVVQLAGSATGGNASSGRTFAWEPAADLSGANTATPTTSIAGSYTLTVTDVATGCQALDTVLVTQDVAVPVAEAGPDRVLTCAAVVATLSGSATGGNGSGGYSYSWAPAADLSGANTASPTTMVPGVYTLTVTDVVNGCTHQDSVTVTQDVASPTAEAGPDGVLTCADAEVTLSGSAAGGNGSLGYSYSWQPATDVSDPAAAMPTTGSAGTYTLIVTDLANGCTATDTVTVTVDVDRPVASAGADRAITCNVLQVTLDGSASGGNGGSGYSFSWTPAADLTGANTATPTTIVPGTYTLLVTDLANGCVDTDVVVVVDDTLAPAASAGPDRVLDCANVQVSLAGSASGGNGSGGYAYAWLPTAGLTGATTATPTATLPDTYTVTVTDLATGCTAQDTVTVTEDVAAPVAEAGPAQAVTCALPVVTLAGSASGGNGASGYAFSWSPAADLTGANTATPTTSVAGDYVLTVTDLANGCTHQDQVTVVADAVLPTAEAGPDRALTCTAPVATLEGSASGGNATQGYAYAWSPAAGLSNAASAMPTTSTAGTWTLTVTAIATGCTAQDTVTVVSDAAVPAAEAGPNRTLTCAVPQVMLAGSASGGNASAGYAYSWMPAGPLTGANTATPTTSTPGIYTLTVTAVATGCTAQDTVQVFSSMVAPTAGAGPDWTLTCTTTTATLLGTASGGNASAGYSYAWTPAGPLTGASTANPTTSTAGVYTLTVTAVATGCMAQDTVEVFSDAVAPLADAGPDRTLTCTTTQVTLAGSASGGNTSFGYWYAWTPASSVSNPTLAAPTTSTPGTYTLTVTAVATGCTSQDTVVVTSDAALPTADAGPDRALTCTTQQVTLAGSASGGNGASGYSYAWTPAAGVSDPVAAMPTTTTPGTYTLTVTAVATGCQAIDTVVVASDTLAPSAGAGPDRVLDCATTQVVLAGTASGGNASLGYAYAWEPAAGVSDPALAAPMTSVPGAYTLTVTAIATGCTSQDVVLVSQDLVPPVAEAGPGRTITCATGSVVLSGAASGGNGGAGYGFAWAPAADVSDATAAAPQTSLPGLYTLTVTDLANGCTSQDQVTVAMDLVAPVSDAGPDRVLTCASPTALLLGAASGGNGSGGYSFAWTPEAGLSDPTAAQPSASAPGVYTLSVTDLANGCTAEDQVTVVADTLAPAADAGPNRVLTCSVTSVMLSGAASGGNGGAGYGFSWQPALAVSDPFAQSPLTSTAGVYTLTVTDLSTGCTAADTVSVAPDVTPPVANAGSDRVLTCSNPTATLQGSASAGNGSAGYTFAWTPTAGLSDASSPTPSASATGTYTLTVTAIATGCTAQDVVQVTADVAAPAASAGADRHLTCAQSVVTLAGSASGGNGSQGYAYAWSPAGNVSSPSAATPTTLLPGAYTLTVTALANGCTAQDVVVVTQDIAAPVVSAGADSAIDCNAPIVVLQGSASGGNGSLGHAWSWEPAGDVSDPSVQAPTTTIPGDYTLTVTDLANGCTAQDTVVVADNAAPVAGAGPDRLLTCVTAQVTLLGSVTGGVGTGGFSYSWLPATGLSDPMALQPTASVPGTYTLVVTDIATGCTAQDEVLVAVDRRAPTANAGPDQRITCAIAQVTLFGAASGGNGTGGYRAAWEPAADVSNPSVLRPRTTVPGTYTLTVTDLVNGCVDEDTVVVSEDVQPPVANAGPDKVLGCGATGVRLEGSASGGNGSGGYSYAWLPAADVSSPFAATPTTSTPGLYTLTVRDLANGCTDTDTVLVTQDVVPPTADAGPDRLLTCVATTVALSGAASGGNGTLGYSYAWSPVAGLSDPNGAAPSADLPGTYILTVTDIASGCTATDSVTVTQDVAVPVADAGPDQVMDCANLVATLAGAASGGNGTAGYAFAWEPAGDVSDPTAQSPTTTIPGTYRLTVTDLANGCQAPSDSVLVSRTVAPLPAEPSAVDLLPAAPPLGVTWVDPATRAELLIRWEDVGAFAHDVSRGAFPAGPFPAGSVLRGYVHEAFACGVVGTSARVAPGSGTFYFVVAGVNCDGVESSYGRSSLGVERPDAAATSGVACP